MRKCLHCGKERDNVNYVTYSNIEVTEGRLIGEAYYCDDCGIHVAEDHIHGTIIPRRYD